MMTRELTYDAWHAEGVQLFGADEMQWRFVCPSCGHIATPAQWREAGAPDGTVAFSCIGRWAGAKGEAFGKKGTPCNYAGGGLFKLNPVIVRQPGGQVHNVFEFEKTEAA